MSNQTEKNSASILVNDSGLDTVLTISALENEMVKLINHSTNSGRNSFDFIYPEYLKRLSKVEENRFKLAIYNTISHLSLDQHRKRIHKRMRVKDRKSHASEVRRRSIYNSLINGIIQVEKPRVGIQLTYGFSEAKVHIIRDFLEKSGVTVTLIDVDAISTDIKVVKVDKKPIIQEKPPVKLWEDTAMNISDINLKSIVVANKIDHTAQLIHEYTVLRRYLTGKDVSDFVDDEQEIINGYNELGKEQQTEKFKSLKTAFYSLI